MYKSLYSTALIACLFGISGALLVLCLFPRTPKIVTVNITGIVDSWTHEIATLKLSETDAKQKAEHFTQVLEQVIKKRGESKRLVILPSEAVISGGDDITTEIQQEIQAELNR